MAATLNARGPESYVGLEVVFSVGIFWMVKLVEKGGKSM